MRNVSSPFGEMLRWPSGEYRRSADEEHMLTANETRQAGIQSIKLSAHRRLMPCSPRYGLTGSSNDIPFSPPNARELQGRFTKPLRSSHLPSNTDDGQIVKWCDSLRVPHDRLEQGLARE